jgi:hypothetical protein
MWNPVSAQESLDGQRLALERDRLALEKEGSWPKSATEVEGFWIQQVGGAAAGVNPRSI